MKNPFFRFAVITNVSTSKPDDMTAHKAVSYATILRISNMVSRCDIDSADLIFEDTERNRGKIERDFNPNLPGLEIADLVIHTTGRQERLKRTPVAGRKFQPDFIEVFHGGNEEYREYISVDRIEQSARG